MVVRRLPLALLLPLLACGTDADGDGFTASSDCNDADAAVFPGAAEICNGVDDDCSGAIDDGIDFAPAYADVDGDGFGGGEPIVPTSCEQAAALVSNGDDCDDDNASAYPGATEICHDGVVNDCGADGVPRCPLEGELDVAWADGRRPAALLEFSNPALIRGLDGSPTTVVDAAVSGEGGVVNIGPPEGGDASASRGRGMIIEADDVAYSRGIAEPGGYLLASARDGSGVYALDMGALERFEPISKGIRVLERQSEQILVNQVAFVDHDNTETCAYEIPDAPGPLVEAGCVLGGFGFAYDGGAVILVGERGSSFHLYSWSLEDQFERLLSTINSDERPRFVGYGNFDGDEPGALVSFYDGRTSTVGFFPTPFADTIVSSEQAAWTLTLGNSYSLGLTPQGVARVMAFYDAEGLRFYALPFGDDPQPMAWTRPEQLLSISEFIVYDLDGDGHDDWILGTDAKGEDGLRHGILVFWGNDP